MKHPTSRFLTTAAAILTATAAIDAQGQFEHDFQEPVGDPATFNVVGPAATGRADHDSNGDAFLESVAFPDGSTFSQYYRPVGITRFSASDDTGRLISVNGGSRISSGPHGRHFLGDEVSDGSAVVPSDADITAFSESLRHAFASNNLNWYMDTGGQPTFEFIIEFDLVLMDNDPEPDDFGELLYFERGSHGGNSWLTIQAVDEHGAPLGPELAITPDSTTHTSPPTQIGSSSQYIGAASVDISRLGVSETQYLLVRSTQSTDSGHHSASRSGIDYQPDFKFMAVITHPAQVALREATYD